MVAFSLQGESHLRRARLQNFSKYFFCVGLVVVGFGVGDEMAKIPILLSNGGQCSLECIE